ncbi:MAG TPA: hypothetical protein VM869_18840 [Enhygromyxa sp.]|nr:hypothetical protein [Enhygromyxa sp.]
MTNLGEREPTLDALRDQGADDVVELGLEQQLLDHPQLPVEREA